MDEAQRRYRHSPKGRAAVNRWKATWAARNPEKARASNRERTRRYRARTGRYSAPQAEKAPARTAVAHAIARGDLTRQPCSDCGSTNAQAHHPNGYDREHWLDIEWLCPVHHATRHPRTKQEA